MTNDELYQKIEKHFTNEQYFAVHNHYSANNKYLYYVENNITITVVPTIPTEEDQQRIGCGTWLEGDELKDLGDIFTGDIIVSPHLDVFDDAVVSEKCPQIGIDRSVTAICVLHDDVITSLVHTLSCIETTVENTVYPEDAFEAAYDAIIHAIDTTILTQVGEAVFDYIKFKPVEL